MTVRDLPCRASAAAIAAAARAAGRADPDEDAVVADTLRGIARQHAGRARGGAPSGRRAGLTPPRACAPRRRTPTAAARTCGCSPAPSPAPFELRAATEPTAGERVVPLGPHQVNRRMQVLAAMLGLEGVSSHSGRRGASTTAVQAAGGWRSASMGRPLRLGRRRRGRCPAPGSSGAAESKRTETVFSSPFESQRVALEVDGKPKHHVGPVSQDPGTDQ